MHNTSVAIAIAMACTCNTAYGTELPVGSNAVVAASTEAATISRSAPRSRPALDFVRQGPAPVPLAKPPLARRQPQRRTICRMIKAAARWHALPTRFLTRLIWQESRFRVSAVSHAGAQGIAQFMPATAAERGLNDPFDPGQALWAAAGLLSSLERRFGNLGLAAAAYNAGPGRVSDWLRNKRRLPEETRNYVEAITGRPASSWAKAAKKGDLGIVVGGKGDVDCPATLLEVAASR
jgi:soluble lytic murein transglycosylase-like protein